MYKRSVGLQHLSKPQRVWVGVCVAATLPFFVRDLGQLSKTPPILHEPLHAPAISIYTVTDEAKIRNKVNLRLEEVRTVIGNGYPAWKPYAGELPEISPTGQTFQANALDRQLLPLDETMYRFTVSWQGEVDETIPALIRSDPGRDGTLYVRNRSFTLLREGLHRMSTWQAIPKGTRTVNVDAGFAFATDTRTLSQFPAPGSLGISYGAKATWGASQNGYLTPVEITLPHRYRPSKAGTYCLKTYTIDRWGMKMLADTRPIVLLPETTTIPLPLPRFPASRDVQAVRVTITPYQWTRFVDVPLTVPSGDVARINPLPVTPDLERQRRIIVQGGSGAVGDYHELWRVRHEDLTHPQLAQFIPDAIILTHMQQSLDSDILNVSRTESHFYAFVPDTWDDPAQNVTLYAITKSGKRVQAMSDDISIKEGGTRIGFQLSGVPYDDVAEVSFGLTQ